MPAFSQKSKSQLETCDTRLQIVLKDAIEEFDFSILEGKRSLEQQLKNVRKGVSKTLNSKHVYPLVEPSLAVDIAPYPLMWPQRPKGLSKLLMKTVGKYVKQTARFYLLAGYILGRARSHDIKLRWGGDWDGDGDIFDQTFDDTPHFELRE